MVLVVCIDWWIYWFKFCVYDGEVGLGSEGMGYIV